MALQEAKGNLATIVVFYGGKPYALVCDANSLLRISLAASEITLPIDIKSQTITPNVDLYQARGEPVGQPPWPIALWTDSIINTALPAGTSNQSGTAVPAGDAVLVQSLCFAIVSGTITQVLLRLVSGAVTQNLIDQSSPTSGQYYIVNGSWLLPAGAFFQVRVIGATLNDDLYAYAWGMKIQD